MYNQGRGTGPYLYNNHAKPHPALPSRPGQPFSAQSAPSYPHNGPIPMNHALVNPYAPNQFTSSLQTNSSGYNFPQAYAGASPSSYSQLNAFGNSSNSNQAHRPLLGNGGGNIACSRQGCAYMGRTNKDVETHMMDRHFIYPHGWNERKRKRDDGPDGDASTSVLVQTYKRKLDTPEEIAAWIAERKRRWPTKERVEEKARAEEDAKARGEIILPRNVFSKSVNNAHPDSTSGPRGRGRGRGNSQGGRGRGRGRGGRNIMSEAAYEDDTETASVGDDGEKGASHSHSSHGRRRVVDRGWGVRGGRGRGRDQGQGATASTNPSIGVKGMTPHDSEETSASDDDTDDASSSSGSDMDPIRDAVSSKPSIGFVAEEDDEGDALAVDEALNAPRDSEDNAEADILEVKEASAPISVLDSQYRIQEPHIRTNDSRPRNRRPAPRPPKQPFNPFQQSRQFRPTLLRNLLTRDVQTTTSNLSQAIRFLVANDCLQGVERWAGEAEELKSKAERVVVLDETENVAVEGSPVHL